MVFPLRRLARLCSCFCLCFFPISALAQSPDDSLAFVPSSGSIPGSVEVYFFPAFPMGDFGDASGSNAGLATLGIGLGIEYVYPVGKTPFGWVTGAAVAINPSDTKKAAELVGDQVPPGDVKADGGTWFNMPFLTGVKIEGHPAPNLAAHVQLQAGLTIVNQADYKFTVQDYSAVMTSETSFTPGFMVGAGVTLFDRLDLGFRFFRTAKASMKADFHDSEGQSAKESGDIAITFSAVTLGVQF